MTFNSVILFLNRRCSVGCPSCSAGASSSNNEELNPSWLHSFYQKLNEIHFSGYLIWTGGEPFFSPSSLKIGLELAASAGYHSEILTSGTWFKTHPGLLEIPAFSPRVSLRVSLDAEHQKKIEIDSILELIRKAIDLKLEINFTLREIPGQPFSSHLMIEKIKEVFPEFYRENSGRSRWIHTIPHIPVNGIGVGSYGKRANVKYKKPCSMIFRDLVIGEDGLVYPCCGFFSLPEEVRKSLSVGDPIVDSWEALINRQSECFVFRVLKEKGPFGLCRESGIDTEVFGEGPFETSCHFCLLLLKSKLFIENY